MKLYHSSKPGFTFLDLQKIWILAEADSVGFQLGYTELVCNPTK
jgi:hypothetical protein